MLPFLGILLFLALGIITLPFLFFGARRLGVPWGTICQGILTTFAMTTAALICMIVVGSELRDWAFSRAADRAEGHPPDSLKDLVPKFIAAIPKTGLESYPEFEYERFKETKGTLAWWDLGSRQGAKMAGLWVYPDGNPEHAILGLQFNSQDTVVDAYVDRMPDTTLTLSFTVDEWHKSPGKRLHMVRDLPNKYEIVGMTRKEIEKLLGSPNGTRILRDSPWELRIQCPSGLINWDVFFYWPTEHYPEEIYSGWVEKIGKWAYVHE